MPTETKPRRPTPPPPPQAVMGLLNYITATSMDEDYAHVSARRTAEPEPSPDKPRRAVAATPALVILALFGLLVATAFVQTARTADDQAERHDELVKQVLARRADLERQRARVDELRSETETLQTVFLQASAEGRSVQARLDRLGVISGAVPARGPGLRIVVDNGPESSGDDAEVLDLDLQKLVNGLWLVGAEAISINGERLSSLSAVRQGGEVITVNFDPISPPYTVTAIGNPDTLATRFLDTPGGQWWLDLHALYGLKFDVNRVETLTLPATDSTRLRHAHVPQTLR